MDALLLKYECQRLAKHGQGRPTAERRKELEAALGSKWEGVQVTAAKSLCAWGDPKSVKAVKAAMVEIAQKHSHATIYTLAKCLGPLLGQDDVEWVFKLYFRTAVNKFALEDLFYALPETAARKCLEEEIRKGGCEAVDVHRANCILSNTSFRLAPRRLEPSRPRPRQPKPGKRRNEPPPYEDD